MPHPTPPALDVFFGNSYILYCTIHLTYANGWTVAGALHSCHRGILSGGAYSAFSHLRTFRFVILAMPSHQAERSNDGQFLLWGLSFYQIRTLSPQ